MRAFLCFLSLITFSTLFADSFERRPLRMTLKLLHALGNKTCLDEVERATSGRFMKLTKKKEEIPQALMISYNSTFELFKNKTISCHWKNERFHELMEHLQRQTESNKVQVLSSELDTLIKDFKLLGDFLIQQKNSCCAWEIMRNELFIVFGHFSRMTAHLHRHI